MAKDVMEKDKQFTLKQVRLQALNMANVCIAKGNMGSAFSFLQNFKGSVHPDSMAGVELGKLFTSLRSDIYTRHSKFMNRVKSTGALEKRDSIIHVEDDLETEFVRLLYDGFWKVALTYELIEVS